MKVHFNILQKLVIILFFIILSCKGNVDKATDTKVKIDKKEEQTKKIKVLELSGEEITSFFTPLIINKLDIKFDIRKVYKVFDNDGETFFIVSEKFLGRDSEGNRIITDIEFLIVSIIEDDYIIKDKISDRINSNEKSIWFWTKFLKLEDFNNDGYVDPIIIHGGLNSESRLIINIFNRNEKYQIIHRASDQDLGRHTKFDENFIELDKPIRLEVINLLKKLNEKYLSLKSETLELMNSFE